jgi:parvulin-like peptidyl-prolyl isomerase
MELEPDEWHGPVLSGYGTHLVYIHEHRVTPPPEFSDVAEQVREDFEEERRRELNEEFLASLLERYEVVIEGQDGAVQAKLMGTPQ